MDGYCGSDEMENISHSLRIRPGGRWRRRREQRQRDNAKDGLDQETRRATHMDKKIEIDTNMI